MTRRGWFAATIAAIAARFAPVLPARFRPAPRREPTPLERAMLKATLEAIHDNLKAVRMISRAYQAEQNRVQIGDTINVRVPARFCPK